MARRTVSGRMVAIDLVERAIRAVEVNYTAGQMEVTGLAAGTLPAPFAEMPAAEVGRALEQVLREGRIGARQALITIPRHLAVLKPLNVPPMERRELLSAILLQAERELPFPVAGAHIDCVPTGMQVAEEKESPEEGRTGVGVLLGAVQSGAVETCRAVLEGAGLSPRRMGLRPCATANALVFAGADTAGQFVALVDIGDAVTEISIVRDRHLIFSRSVTIGASPSADRPPSAGDDAEEKVPTDRDAAPGDEVPVFEAELLEGAAEEQGLSLFSRWQEALVVEVRRSLEAFAVQPGGGPISALYLTGVGAGDEQLAGAIAEALGTRVAVLDPFEGLDLHGRAGRRKGDNLAAFASALGTAIAEGEDLVPGFDFLAPLEQRLREAPSRRPLVAVGLGVAVLVLAIGVPTWLFKAKQAELGRFEAEIREKKKGERIVNDINERIQELAPWTDPAERVSWYEVYEALSKSWPDQKRAYLNQLRLQRGNLILLGGRAQNEGVVEALLDALHRAKEFGAPDIRRQRPGADKLGYPIEFQISVRWVGPAPDASPTTTRGAS